LRICLVCSGNICRSPTAEVILVEQLRAAGLGDSVQVDSAGIGDWHVGDDMDRRSRAALVAAGYQPERHRARQFWPSDFAQRDLVLALDESHRRDLLRLADRTNAAAANRAKVVLLRSFDPSAEPGAEVADPYFGDADGFVEVLGQIERAGAGLVESLRESPGRVSDTQP
jgi:protein-tyrosine phosphatase